MQPRWQDPSQLPAACRSDSQITLGRVNVAVVACAQLSEFATASQLLQDAQREYTRAFALDILRPIQVQNSASQKTQSTSQPGSILLCRRHCHDWRCSSTAVVLWRPRFQHMSTFLAQGETECWPDNHETAATQGRMLACRPHEPWSRLCRGL